MSIRVLSSIVIGTVAYPLSLEVSVQEGIGTLMVQGLPEDIAAGSQDRDFRAIRESGFRVPENRSITVTFHPGLLSESEDSPVQALLRGDASSRETAICPTSLKRITVNLAPADVRKAGPSFDLPIAVGLLVATGQLSGENLEGALLVGELSLDGGVRPVTGALPIAIGARDRKITRLYVPAGNAREAAIVGDVDVFPVATLAEIVRALALPETLEPMPRDPTLLNSDSSHYAYDFADVKGHAAVKRALEVAAAGGHNMILIGPPGSGKTMMARRLPSILPPMSVDEALEATKLYFVAGMLSSEVALVNTCPFRSPHHTVSTAALVGGGAVPRPGEVSLSHHGVLFLDELPEFNRDALEVLRQPLEDGVVSVSRVSASYTYPADFCLIAAMNPCPCGYYGDVYRQCSCNATQVQKYQKKISGPLLDRIDIQIEVPRLSEEELLQSRTAESSRAIRERVKSARSMQQRRFAQPMPDPDPPADPDQPPHPADAANENISRPKRLCPLFCNAQMGPKEIRAYCTPSDEVKALLRVAIQQLGLSGGQCPQRCAAKVAIAVEEGRKFRMSIGAAPNLSGGLWMAQTSVSSFDSGNGDANTDVGTPCDPGGGGNGGGDTCSVSSGNSPIGTPNAPVPLAATQGAPPPGIPPILNPCPPYPGGPTPAAVPGPSLLPTPNVNIQLSDSVDMGEINGLPILCQESGVTLTSTCSVSAFYFFTSGFTAHFTILGGTAENCTDSTDYSYLPTAHSQVVGSFGTPVTVTRV